jgi:two-component system chemotaxis sensor kinase CheA
MTYESTDREPFSIPVLVVEDDPDLRTLLRTFLQDEEYTVGEASDGQVALDLLRQTSERWVVLADHQMPRLNGAGLIAAVLADPQLSARHAFIYMTATDRVIPPDLQLQLQTLDAPILGKPFSFDACLATVATAAKRLADAEKPS